MVKQSEEAEARRTQTEANKARYAAQRKIDEKRNAEYLKQVESMAPADSSQPLRFANRTGGESGIRLEAPWP